MNPQRGKMATTTSVQCSGLYHLKRRAEQQEVNQAQVGDMPG